MKNNLKRWGIVLLFMTAGISGCMTYSTLTREESQILGEILDMLDTTITEAEEKIQIRPDPTSPLKKFTEKLADRREYLKMVEAGEVPYDPELVSKYSDEVRDIQVNIRNPVERVLETDISFGLGKYEIANLADEGRKVLGEFAREIMSALVDKQKKLFPDRTFVITVRTIGYADEVQPGPKLTEALTEGEKESLPQDPVERRKVLNRELSRRRSQTINEYITMKLEAELEYPQVKIGVPEIMGLGEEFPYLRETIFPPYKSEDKRRRICKVHGKVLRQ